MMTIIIRDRPFFPTDFKIRTTIVFLLTHPSTPKSEQTKLKIRRILEVIIITSNMLTGLQIFSPWAEFSPWEINFGHSRDQCKSVEKKISIWEGGRGQNVM